MISNNKRLQAIKEQQLIRVELAICFAMLPINDYTVYISILMDKLQYRSQNDKGDMIDMEHELRQKMNQSQLIRFYKKVIVSFETSKSFFIRGGIGKYYQFTSDGDLNPQFMDSNRNELQRVTNCNDYSEGDVMRYKSVNRQMAKQGQNGTVSGVTCFRYNQTYQSFEQQKHEHPSQFYIILYTFYRGIGYPLSFISYYYLLFLYLLSQSMFVFFIPLFAYIILSNSFAILLEMLLIVFL
eukprot:932821_1